MAVYVDDMRAKYGRMIMCHMLADTEEELHDMAVKIGVVRRWHQKPGTPHSHYDICLSKRAKAVNLGALEIDRYAVKKILDAKRLSATPSTANKEPSNLAKQVKEATDEYDSWPDDKRASVQLQGGDGVANKEVNG